MKIYDQNLSGTGATQAGGPQEAQRAGAGTNRSQGASTGSDRVELSTTLSSLSRAVNSDQSARAGRVQELAELYQRGGYQPDSYATSRAIVAEMLPPGIG
jgi:hypothetical protein